MYEAYFHLQKRPFSATPDANCLYAPEPIRKLLDELSLAVQSGQGIGVLTAVAGTGKTLLCRRLLLDIERRFTPIFLANANFSTRRELLQAIHFELGRRYGGEEEQELRLELVAALESLALSGRPAALIVDEAHLLNERLLEELRTLASLDNEAQPLLRMILVGQMALEMRLIDPSLEALNQRIVYQGYLDPLTRQQSREYVEFRVRWAGGDAVQLFEPMALDLIAEACNGLPRCLNQLCDHSLLLTFVQEAPRVTRAIVEAALADLRQLPLHWNESLDMADELINEGMMEDEFGDIDTWDKPALDPQGSDPLQNSAAAASFEIGGDVPTEPLELLALDAPITTSEAPTAPWTTITPIQPIQCSRGSIQEDAPSPAPSSGTRVFREELVDDRYAALDLHAPLLVRAYEDAANPQDWRHTLLAPVATVPASVALRANHSDVTNEAAATEPGPEIQNRLIAGDTRSTPSGEGAASRSISVTEDGDALLMDKAVGSRQEFEEEIGNDVLEVCLDVQNSLGEWWEPGPVDASAAASVDTGRVEPRAGSPYDVVEPDRSGGLANATVDELLASVRNQATTGRYVPKPNYKHMFSKLRRKIGRSPR